MKNQTDSSNKTRSLYLRRYGVRIYQTERGWMLYLTVCYQTYVITIEFFKGPLIK